MDREIYHLHLIYSGGKLDTTGSYSDPHKTVKTLTPTTTFQQITQHIGGF